MRRRKSLAAHRREMKAWLDRANGWDGQAYATDAMMGVVNMNDYKRMCATPMMQEFDALPRKLWVQVWEHGDYEVPVFAIG